MEDLGELRRAQEEVGSLVSCRFNNRVFTLHTVYSTGGGTTQFQVVLFCVVSPSV